jgi:hypothetical protein
MRRLERRASFLQRSRNRLRRSSEYRSDMPLARQIRALPSAYLGLATTAPFATLEMGCEYLAKQSARKPDLTALKKTEDKADNKQRYAIK